jgi:hypothetical protein
MRIASPTRASLFSFPCALVGIAALCATLAGCGSEKKIEHYQVDKPSVLAARYFPDSAEGANPPLEADSNAAPTDRMLAAIVPHGSQYWFFKLTGPIPAVDAQVVAFQQFLKTVHFAKQPDGSPEWTLPAGWTGLPGNGPRFATIKITGPEPLELSVSPLPKRDDEPVEDAVLSNVNRWRKQMSLSAISAEGLASDATTFNIDGEKATVVDLTGNYQGMGGPFMNGLLPAGHRDVGQAFQPDGAPSSSSPSNIASSGSPSLPAGHPPISPDASPTSETPPAGIGEPSADFTFIAPAGWQPGEMNAMRKAAFIATDGSQTVEITVSALPNSPMSADELANVNRWRGQINLPKTTDDELHHDAKSISVDGIKASYFTLTGPAQPAPQRAIYAVMAPADDQVWFIKMSGDAKLAEREKLKFEAFLKSIKFTGK